MKKIILAMFFFFFAFSTVNASDKELKTNEVKSEITTVYRVSAFCKLIQMGNYDAVKALIETGEDVNKKSTGLSPLMFAARHNRAQIVKLLLKNGAKLNTKSDKGNMTALDMAKRSKAVDAIKVIKAAL
jgi:ankyrin repeat protein